MVICSTFFLIWHVAAFVAECLVCPVLCCVVAVVSVRPHCAAVCPVAILEQNADAALCNADRHVHALTR